MADEIVNQNPEADKAKMPKGKKQISLEPLAEDAHVPPHISEHTRVLKGFDPDTGERVAINLQALQHEHGEKKGMELYSKVARAGGFLDPAIESRGGSEFYPDLTLEGMDKKARAKVDAILEGTKE